MRIQQGFSLVELMVALAVLVILISVAIPSFTSSLLKAKASSLADSLISSLNYAKSTAISNNERYYLCARDANSDDCLTNALNWNGGWLVRRALNNDTVRDVLISEPNAEVSLDDGNGAQNAMRLVFTASGEILLMSALGVPAVPVNAVFSTQIANCDDPQLNIRRQISLALSGLITVNSTVACQ